MGGLTFSGWTYCRTGVCVCVSNSKNPCHHLPPSPPPGDNGTTALVFVIGPDDGLLLTVFTV